MLDSSEKSAHLDREMLADNIRRARKNQKLSQTELAKRAGVDLASVFRVEKGVSTRLNTLKKIAKGLNVIFEDLLIVKSTPDPTHHFAVNRAAESLWFPCEDRRQRVPPNDEELCQIEAERHRLGRLGFVPFFMCPPVVIAPRGPGVVLLEIYEECTEAFNAEFYEDAALLLIRGGGVVTIGEKTVELQEGDWIAYKSKEIKRMAVLPPHEVAAFLWIGANRVTKAT